MTDPAPSVQPVRAWAVYDKNGVFVHLIDGQMTEREQGDERGWWDSEAPYNAPHRVIRVEIRKVRDGE